MRSRSDGFVITVCGSPLTQGCGRRVCEAGKRASARFTALSSLKRPNVQQCCGAVVSSTRPHSLKPKNLESHDSLPPPAPPRSRNETSHASAGIDEKVAFLIGAGVAWSRKAPVPCLRGGLLQGQRIARHNASITRILRVLWVLLQVVVVMLGLSGLSRRNEKQALRLESHSLRSVQLAVLQSDLTLGEREASPRNARTAGQSPSSGACPLLLPILQSRGQLGQYLRDQGFT